MSSGNNLNFKMGSLAKLIDNSQSKMIENGDILFGKYGPDANNPKAGSLYIQSNGTLLPVSFPPSSKKYMPLVGMGAGNPPEYSHIIALGDVQTAGAMQIYGGSSDQGYIAINSSSVPTENLYVNGSAKILGTTTLGDAYADTITLNGKVILIKDRTYGTANPTNNTSLGTATVGQVYFKIIE